MPRDAVSRTANVERTGFFFYFFVCLNELWERFFFLLMTDNFCVWMSWYEDNFFFFFTRDRQSMWDWLQFFYVFFSHQVSENLSLISDNFTCFLFRQMTDSFCEIRNKFYFIFSSNEREFESDWRQFFDAIFLRVYFFFCIIYHSRVYMRSKKSWNLPYLFEKVIVSIFTNHILFIRI